MLVNLSIPIFGVYLITCSGLSGVVWTQVISDLKGNKIVGTFCVKELQKQIKKSLDLKRQ